MLQQPLRRCSAPRHGDHLRKKNNRGPLSFSPTSAGSGATKGGLPNVPVDIHGLRKWCMAWSCLGCLHFAGLKSLDE